MNLKYISIIFLSLNLQLNSQCLLIETSIENLSKSSEIIVEAEVVQNFTTWGKDQKIIYTIHELKVYGTFKGEKTKNIYVATQGGIIGDKMLIVQPELKLEIGDVGILFLDESKELNHLNLRNPVYFPCFNAQSFFKYDVISNTANGVFKNFVLDEKQLDREIETITNKPYRKIENLKLNILKENSSNSRMITSFSPTTITAGTKSVLTINGSGFGSAMGSVQFKYSSDGGVAYVAVQPFEIISWSNTQITVEVPDNAGTGTIRVVPSGGSNITSSSALIIISSQTLIYESNASKKTRHSVTAATSNKIIYTLNTDFNNNTAAKESFLRAMKTWKCENDVNWDISASTNSISTAADDNVNIISFGSIGGPLGIAYSYYNGCSSPTIWHLTEMDIIFEPSVNWNFSTTPPIGSQIDFESVALHELGHTLLLGHIVDVNKVMHWVISNQQMKRDPTPDENTAVADVMSRSTSNSSNMCGYFKLNYAPNIVVTSTADSGAGTLRQAIIDVCANDTITIQNTVSSINLSSAELTIDKNMKIHGYSQPNFSISGMNARRIFNIQVGKTLSLQSMKLINSTSVTNGGAIYNNGILNLKNVTFQNNFQNGVRKAFTSPTGTTVNSENSVIINN